MTEIKRNQYRVWYAPYGYPEESDYMDVEAKTEKEAREIVSASGWVESVEQF